MKKLILLFSIIIFCSCSSDNNPQLQQQTCQTPNVTVTDLALTEATLNFTSLTSAEIEFEYGEEGFVQGSGNTIISSESMYVLDNLEVFKSYDVYAKSICTDIESDWFGPINFITQCNVDNGIYEGNVTLTTQQEIDDFGAMCYSGINGYLDIRGVDDSDIVSLLPLINISSVDKLIISLTSITSLKGINLNTLNESFQLIDNDLLIDFNGINIPSSINNIFLVAQNDALLSFEGLEELTYIYFLWIVNNNNLESFNGFNNITSMDFSEFNGNASLLNFIGFDSLTSLKDIYVIDTYFENFLGLESLTNVAESNLEFILIHSNEYLTSLNGLQNLVAAPKITIGEERSSNEARPNPLLSDFCALQNLFSNGVYGDVIIENNAYNPTVQDIIDGNCSQ